MFFPSSIPVGLKNWHRDAVILAFHDGSLTLSKLITMGTHQIKTFYIFFAYKRTWTMLKHSQNDLLLTIIYGENHDWGKLVPMKTAMLFCCNYIFNTSQISHYTTSHMIYMSFWISCFHMLQIARKCFGDARGSLVSTDCFWVHQGWFLSTDFTALCRNHTMSVVHGF